MRIVNVASLKGHEILGRPFFDEAGRVLLNTGARLSMAFMEKAKEMGLKSVIIDDEISKDVVITQVVSEKTRQAGKSALKDTVAKYFKEKKADNTQIVHAVNSIIDEILRNRCDIVNVTDIRDSENNLYTHSVNVCVLTTMIASHMGHNMIKLKDISLGAILHDIGKSRIINDRKITEKFKSKQELDKYVETMHPKAGYDFLTDEDFCNAHSKVAVLMHHEKLDGSGFPLKLKGDEINEVAKLTTVCNVFENMISGNSNGHPASVFDTLKYISAMSGNNFDPEVVKTFIKSVAAFPSGSAVRLSSGEKCLVVRQNASTPTRPVVKAIYDKAGVLLAEPYEMDLLKDVTMHIIEQCEL